MAKAILRGSITALNGFISEKRAEHLQLVCPHSLSAFSMLLGHGENDPMDGIKELPTRGSLQHWQMSEERGPQDQMSVSQHPPAGSLQFFPFRPREGETLQTTLFPARTLPDSRSKTSRVSAQDTRKKGSKEEQ